MIIRMFLFFYLQSQIDLDWPIFDRCRIMIKNEFPFRSSANMSKYVFEYADKERHSWCYVEWSMANNWEVKAKEDDKMSYISSEDWTNVNAWSSLPFERNQVNTGFGLPLAEQSNRVPRLL